MHAIPYPGHAPGVGECPFSDIRPIENPHDGGPADGYFDGAVAKGCGGEPLAGRGEILPRLPSRGVDEQRLILVVEDDDATRAFLLDNLAADGFKVAGASGAGEGMRAIQVRQPALVVLDLLLGEGSGLGLLDRVRAADGLSSRIDPELPVIVLSGRASEADRVRSFARGADDHLCKPSCCYR